MVYDCGRLKKHESIEYRHRPELCYVFSSSYARLELSSDATMMLLNTGRDEKDQLFYTLHVDVVVNSEERKSTDTVTSWEPADPDRPTPFPQYKERRRGS